MAIFNSKLLVYQAGFFPTDEHQWSQWDPSVVQEQLAKESKPRRRAEKNHGFLLRNSQGHRKYHENTMKIQYY